MGLGSTAKKLQKVADIAEKLFKRINQMREEIKNVQAAVDNTETDTAELRRELAETRALVEAVADAEGIDTDDVLAGVEYPETLGQTEAERAAEAEDTGGESSGESNGE
jgi:septal ring factor EnvC (AmiA/AmiB activator)